jgi:hypothetical protein
MVGACALRASRAGGDATLAWGIGNTVRLLIGVCALAPVIVPNAARIAVLAVVKSSFRRFIAQISFCRVMLLSPGHHAERNDDHDKRGKEYDEDDSGEHFDEGHGDVLSLLEREYPLPVALHATTVHFFAMAFSSILSRQ